MCMLEPKSCWYELTVWFGRPWLRRVSDKVIYINTNVYCFAPASAYNFIQALSYVLCCYSFLWQLNVEFEIIFVFRSTKQKQAIKRGMGRASVWICSLVALILCLCALLIFGCMQCQHGNRSSQILQFSRKHSQTNKCNRQHSIC